MPSAWSFDPGHRPGIPLASIQLLKLSSCWQTSDDRPANARKIYLFHLVYESFSAWLLQTFGS
jgi:hypothetical protein